MKVILTTPLVYPFHPYGGVEKYVYALAGALVAEGIDVEIVASLPEGRQRRETHEGIAYTFVPPYINWAKPALLPTLYHLPFTFNVAGYLRKQSFDILHSYGINPYAYLHLRGRVPVVYQPFERVYATRGLPMVGDKTRWLKRRLVHRVVRHFDVYSITHADAIASEGDFQNETLAQLLGDNCQRIFNLPVGVNIQSIDKVLKSGKLSRQDLGLSSNNLILISVNRLDKVKGINYLVDAFALVKHKVRNAKLILIGTGPDEERIKGQIEANNLTDSIVPLKNIPEDLLYQYYALSDIYVSPTLQTGSIMSMLEAMVCAKPVVSTGQDFWVKDGVNGHLVPQRDPAAMAQAILDMYKTGKCREFGRMSRKIAQDFDYPVIARMAIEEYEKLLGK